MGELGWGFYYYFIWSGTKTIPGDINIAVNVVPVLEISIFVTKLTFRIYSNVEAVSFYKTII